MGNRPRLELTWIGKLHRPTLEPRVLLPDEAQSYHADKRVSERDIYDNRLIFGDNLLALKALELEFAGAVKCVYIDPPFNAEAATEHYVDGLEHSQWLAFMRDRMLCLHRLLRNDGSLYVHLDDNEIDYCKVLLDEVFGRGNFISRITVDARAPSAFSTVNPGVFKASEYVLWYAKDRALFSENEVRVPRDPDYAYSKWLVNPHENPERWRFESVAAAYERLGGQPRSRRPDVILRHFHQFIIQNAQHICRLASISDTGAGREIVALKRQSLARPGVVLTLSRGSNLDAVFILDGQQLIFYSKNVHEIDGCLTASMPLTNVWTDIAWEGIAGEGGVEFKKGKKPERLIRRCVHLATNPGDLVLDSFAGSGTTGAVAHKMGRRWIMIEQGEHCHTHIIPRLKKVIDGQDPGGVTEATGWKGGGGFRYFRVAPSLMEQDRFGNWVISGKVGPAMLAEAVCKLEGFRYEPSDSVWWQHGRSTENDFLYVTRQTLAREDLQRLSDEVGPQRTLLVMCGAFRCRDLSAFPNLTVKKIPAAVLDRCEWGKDDYSLAVAALPPPEPGSEEPAEPKASKSGGPKRKDKGAGTGSLFTPKADA